MAAHLRKQIREAVALALTGLTTTATRVFQSRVYPLEATDLPGLLIATESEESALIEMSAPMLMERRLRLQVFALAKGVADVDDTLDQICKEVEIALAMPCAALNGLAKSIELSSTEIDFDGASEQPLGRATLRFEVVYFCEQNAPDVAQ